MNFELNLNDEFLKYVSYVDNYNDRIINTLNICAYCGIRYAIHFPEVGYGASVIKRPGSYGYYKDLWELALLSYDESEKEWHLDYEAIVDYDVLGDLTDDQVNTVLKYISKGKVHKHINIHSKKK